MHINVKVEKTYDLTGLTETQAQDLLDICLGDPARIQIDIRDNSVEETLNTIRQALLNVSVAPTNRRGEE